eukprot:5157394-Amphidinium_carterae.2
MVLCMGHFLVAHEHSSQRPWDSCSHDPCQRHTVEGSEYEATQQSECGIRRRRRLYTVQLVAIYARSCMVPGAAKVEPVEYRNLH